ncbi:succinyl-diaminopimelate desuccinylase [Bdellovibrio bacteriovorus]|uniref:Succinyl-diaminopimelate desuccinylase n=1 Tax=Bdellovibrio bacteriovorus TaxID=959 RepID=A0A150WQS1_BDEBC|nr:M20/M25/M40 family metallo-hydrolase [Bdellovibrio bacteriovorus]KYG66843.1 succinyl-diaminopimelate desuccinylase [Bdellovibrio bacteriovorus]
MDFIEACRQLIAIDSTPSNGTKELSKWVAAFARQKGFHVEEQEEIVGDVSQVNVIVRPVSERPEVEFLLQTHLDTVDPGPYPLWTETDANPFDAHIIDGKIYGLGAADVKLDFLCKLEAMAAVGKDRAWRLPPVLVGTFGEESGMQGALKLIRKNKISARMALIGEPSDLHLINAAKGFASVEIRVPFSEQEKGYREEHNLRESTSTQSKLFRGKAAHSSTPHLGESAISKMFESLLMLPDSVNVMEMDGGINGNTVPSNAFLEIDMVTGIEKPISKRIANIYKLTKVLEQEFLKYSDPEFIPSSPTLNIGLVRTNESEIQISGTCRIPPNISQEIYESWMERLRQVCIENDAEFRVNDYKKPFRTEVQSILVKGCLDELRAMGLPDRPITQPSTNEASIFSRVGIDCVCFGPGKREGNVHTPQEHVSLEDLEKAKEFYKRIIERFCV